MTLRRRRLTKEELAKKTEQHTIDIIESTKIIKKIKDSMIVTVPVECCKNCRDGETRHGGWGGTYEGTCCKLLYKHTTVVSGSHKAFKDQNVDARTWCSLYKNRKG
ncbi:MAG: hypothetical protein ABIL06_16215 [Pseudomonadota bacterium]